LGKGIERFDDGERRRCRRRLRIALCCARVAHTYCIADVRPACQRRRRTGVVIMLSPPFGDASVDLEKLLASRTRDADMHLTQSDRRPIGMRIKKLSTQ